MTLKKQYKMIIFVITLALLTIYVIFSLSNSASFWHIYHLASPSKDLYEPIVVDSFHLHEKGFTKTYTLKPKYKDMYCIGLISETQKIPWGYSFSGNIKVEFFWKDVFLFEKIITSSIASAHADDKSKFYKNTCLTTFAVPLQNKYKKDISLRLTVLEPDETLKEYGNSIKFFIGVSTTP